MARPKTKGPTIAFRLDTDLHEALAQMALQRGMTPTAFVQHSIERSIRNRMTPEPDTSLNRAMVEPRFPNRMK